uniref:Uncharacterized protein n=1 Tax=Arundo donax TaxID=35708 RepID=A0A0A8Y2P1_ARUDO
MIFPDLRHIPGHILLQFISIQYWCLVYLRCFCSFLLYLG